MKIRLSISILIFIVSFVLPLNGEEETKYIGEQVPAEVEKMYKRGLDFLVSAQLSNGSWPSKFTEDKHGVNIEGETALALLAFMATGTDPNSGPYSKCIKRGMKYLLSRQNRQGYIGSTIYNHAFSVLALAESYGHLEVDGIGPALEKSVAFMVSAQKQNPFKAWRYRPNSQDADLSATGACLVALAACRNADIYVPQSSIDKALKYVQKCYDKHKEFKYSTTTSHGTYSIRCIGNLCNVLLKNDLTASNIRSIRKMPHLPYKEMAKFWHYYYIYYRSQVLYQTDLKAFAKWNKENIAFLKKDQNSDGSFGKIFICRSSMALLSLALNYRLLPIYER